VKQKIIASLFLLGLFLVTAGWFYLASDQYDAKWSTSYLVEETTFGYAKETDSTVGVIVYGGGKVDPLSYAYLTELDANVFFVRFPFNLAVFSINRGERVIQSYPDISTWVVVGHSLGGSMGYVFSQNNDAVDGVVYLASYPTGATDRPSLAIFGTNDGLLQVDDYLDRFSPGEVVLLDGGNHAGFGEYGDQSGDLLATISSLEQREFVLDQIQMFLDSLSQNQP
jgi:hypothetical protein